MAGPCGRMWPWSTTPSCPRGYLPVRDPNDPRGGWLLDSFFCYRCERFQTGTPAAPIGHKQCPPGTIWFEMGRNSGCYRPGKGTEGPPWYVLPLKAIIPDAGGAGCRWYQRDDDAGACEFNPTIGVAGAIFFMVMMMMARRRRA